MALRSDPISLWCRNEPDVDTCAICGRPIIGFATREERNTGPLARRQTWWYCVPCWDYWVQETNRRIDWTRIASTLSDWFSFPEV